MSATAHACVAVQRVGQAGIDKPMTLHRTIVVAISAVSYRACIAAELLSLIGLDRPMTFAPYTFKAASAVSRSTGMHRSQTWLDGPMTFAPNNHARCQRHSADAHGGTALQLDRVG